MPLRRFFWTVLALSALSVVDTSIGITQESLGQLYWPYIIVSTVIVMVIVCHILPKPPVPPPPPAE